MTAMDLSKSEELKNKLISAIMEMSEDECGNILTYIQEHNK